jgi:hypothetical protein
MIFAELLMIVFDPFLQVVERHKSKSCSVGFCGYKLNGPVEVPADRLCLHLRAIYSIAANGASECARMRGSTANGYRLASGPGRTKPETRILHLWHPFKTTLPGERYHFTINESQTNCKHYIKPFIEI